jgi:ankyrin repeat protein
LADPDFEDDFERWPLHWYAIRDDIAAMRAFLQHRATVNPIESFEKPLHEATQRNLDTVELLVDHGADVRERDLGGNAPLHLAAITGSIDVVRFLVERWPEGKEALSNNERHRCRCLRSRQDVRFNSVKRRRRTLLHCWAVGIL